MAASGATSPSERGSAKDRIRPFAVIRKADVRLDGEKLAEPGDGRFVGQIAYITGEKAPVSIVAKRSTRIISWSHVKLKTFSKTGLM